MRKIVKKIMPCAPWYIGELESWFSDMAKKGLILDEFNNISAKFYREEPAELRFRIDIIQNPDKLQEQIDLYAESGWGFAAKFNKYYVYASYTENNDPELHTDPAEQAFTLKKYLRNSALLFLLLQMVLLLYIIYILPANIFNFVQGNYGALNFGIYIMWGETVFVKEIISLKRIQRYLFEGKSINHSTPWKKRRRRRVASICLVAISLIMTIVFSVVALPDSKEKTLPIANNALPILRLADIEQNPDLVRYTDESQDGVDPNDEYTHIIIGHTQFDQNNWYTYTGSYLAPAQYVIRETGAYKNQGQESEAEDTEPIPSLYAQMYRLRYAGMNRYVLTGLLRTDIFRTFWVNTAVISNQRFDKIFAYQEKNKKAIYAAKGDYVVYLYYTGDVDVDTVIEAVADKLESLENLG